MKITWKIIVLTLIVRLVGQRLVFKQPHVFGHRYHVIFLLLVSFLFLHIFSANKQTRQRNKREREREIILSYRNIVSATLNHTHTQTHILYIHYSSYYKAEQANQTSQKKKKKLTKKNHWHSRESKKEKAETVLTSKQKATTVAESSTVKSKWSQNISML